MTQGTSSGVRRGGAVALVAGAMGLCVGLLVSSGEPTAQAQLDGPGPVDGGIVTSTDQRRMMIRELRQVNERLSRIEAKLNEPGAGAPGR